MQKTIQTEPITGKKLLILAGSANEAELVRRAKELGVYTIVTDYYTPEESPAKAAADEYWNISWSDIDALEKRCREEAVDGVTGGYSEFVVENVIRLCERLGLPCYCTMEQLEITRDKRRFKALCRQLGIPVTKEYAGPQDVDAYPVIVKPTDRAGSIGVAIADDSDELQKAYAHASGLSRHGDVIIEAYCSGGTKFDAYYAIVNDRISLLATGDTINAEHPRRETLTQGIWLYPSRHQPQYEALIDEKMRRLIRKLDIHNGYIAFSGIRENDAFAFFECGFRLTGEHVRKFVTVQGYPDVQDVLIRHALTGNAAGPEYPEIVRTAVKSAVLNLYASEDTAGDASGIERIRKNPDCRLIIDRYGKRKPGTENGGTTKIAMLQFYNEKAAALQKDVEDAYNTIAVYGADHENAIAGKADPSLIADWWND